jgi:hypothetical protein
MCQNVSCQKGLYGNLPGIDSLTDNDECQLDSSLYLPLDEVRLEDPVDGSDFLIENFLDLTFANSISIEKNH